MHIIDTDTYERLHEEHPRVIARFRELPPEEQVVTTVITKIETLRGRMDYLFKAANEAEFLRAQQLLARTEELLQRLPILLLDAAAIAHFERIRRLKGLKKIGRGDLLIAGIALARQATLVSRNLRDFQRIPNLRVVNWVD
jgi:tRNA(fMet)-specific endonuclease VapC